MPITGVQSLLLDVTCWDKDRFGKDYMGGFELALEDIFANEKTEQEPKWYPLKSKRPKKKKSVVSGEVLLQFTLLDTTNNQATQKEIFDKFRAIVGADGESWSRNATPTATPLTAPAASSGAGGTLGPAAAAGRRRRGSPPLSNTDADEETPLDEEDEIETPPEEGAEAASKPESAEKRRRRRRLRVKGLKKRKRQGAFAFNNDSDVVGIIYLEIVSIKDLPPESNLTRTSFDMDPFVVTSLGKRTFRTKVVRHNLNPVFNEKMIFQVLNHEQSYSIAFTVIDHDTYSNNDFIASASLSVADLVDRAPKANPETGLFELREPPEYSPPAAAQRSRFRLPMSRSASSQSLNKAGNGNGSRPVPAKNSSASVVPSAAAVAAAIATPGAMSQQAAGAAGLQSSGAEQGADVTQQAQVQAPLPSPGAVGSQGQLAAGGDAAGPSQAAPGVPAVNEASDEDPDFTTFSIPLKMKNTEKWEDKHNPVLYVRAKYMPYPALRQQFWRAMLKQYDTDESGRISKVELTTMLDTLGSTLRESTIDSFFKRFPHKVAGAGGEFDCDLTMDEAVICLEDQLDARNRQQQSAGAAMVDRVRGMLPDADRVRNMLSVPQKGPASGTTATPTLTSESTLVSTSAPTLDASTSTIVVPELQSPGEEGEVLDRADDLNVDKSEEHVVEIRECPICHQPRLNKRKDADIITHVATCASSDWRQVNNLVMAGFVTASQAQRKWYSKVITKISYGGYRLGANSANILVQDRITGQISEEKMSVYVRLGIRLLYKGLKSNNMENKRSKFYKPLIFVFVLYFFHFIYLCTILILDVATKLTKSQSENCSRASASNRARNLMTLHHVPRSKSSSSSTSSTCPRCCSPWRSSRTSMSSSTERSSRAHGRPRRPRTHASPYHRPTAALLSLTASRRQHASGSRAVSSRCGASWGTNTRRTRLASRTAPWAFSASLRRTTTASTSPWMASWARPRRLLGSTIRSTPWPSAPLSTSTARTFASSSPSTAPNLAESWLYVSAP